MNMVTEYSNPDNTAALPPGYMQTEVGVIPEDWEVKTLVELCPPKCLVRGPFGGALKKESFIEYGFKIYEQRNAIYKSCDIGSYFISRTKFDEMQRFSIDPGDFIISCSGTIGRIYQIPSDAAPGIINQALLKIRTDERVVYDKFFYIVFEWNQFQARIIDSTQGGAMQNLVGMDVFKKTPVVLPPYPEQRAIAAVLSDVDMLIGALDKLIAKKQAIKLATMQQLLTGKTRLPGFSGEWETKKLDDVFQFLNTANNPRSDLSDYGSVKYIHYGDIHTRTASFLDCESDSFPLIDADKVRTIPFLEDGDLVMVDASEDYEGIGKSIEVRNAAGRNVVAGLHTLLLRGNKGELTDGFKRYLQFIPAVKKALIKIATGISVYGVSKNNVKNIEVRLPHVKEQRAIATVLSDMDDEIAALERRRGKTRAIKQGMMQVLLTGRVRLVKRETSA